MDRVRFWGPRFFGKHWGPISAGLTVGEMMYNDAYNRVNNWALTTGLKRDRSGRMIRRGPIPPRLKQQPLILPAQNAQSNNLNMEVEMRGRSRSRSSIRARSRSRSRGPRPSGIPGRYTGPAAVPNKRPKVDKSDYALRGSRGQTEQNIKDVGTFAVDTPNVSMIAFTSMIRNPTKNGTVGTSPNIIQAQSAEAASAPTHVALALFRMILKRHFNVDISHPSQSLSAIGFATMGGLNAGNVQNPAYIEFMREYLPESYGTTGGSVKSVIDTPYTLNLFAENTTARSVWEIAQEIAKNVICDRAYGATGPIVVGNRRVIPKLFGYRLQIRDANNTGTEVRNYMGIVRLDNYKIKVKTKTVIYFQNTTRSDSNGLSTDVIDTNPVNGKIYFFEHPNPVVRTYLTANDTKEWKIMHDANGDGIILPDADISSNGSSFTQLPSTDVFKNLKAYSKVRLEPGEMKSFKLNFFFYGYINKFITALQLQDPNGVTPAYSDGGASIPPVTGGNPTVYQYNVSETSGALGTCALFAFEKTLSTGTGGPLITYQRNTYTSAVWVKSSKQTTLPYVTAEVAAGVDRTTD